MADQERYDVAIEIQEMVKNVPPPSSNECCIYKVPHRLRKLNPDAYTPRTVSIGPFHYGNPQQLEIESLKPIYCQKFIARSETSLDDLVNRVRELEPRVRACYSEDIKLSVKKFIKVIFVDCCFILELFMRSSSEQVKPWLMEDIIWDLHLIENQLPFFVFHEIFRLAFGSRLKNDCQKYFLKIASSWLSNGKDCGEMLPSHIDKIKHFIDLYRYLHLQPLNSLPIRGDECLTHLYTATELKEAGVKLKVNKESTHFLDMQFSGNCFRIPEFKVEDTTEIILRNIIAFEQCHYPHEPFFTDYVELLDCLINTERDVDILVNKKIIVNWLGDNNSVAKMFNGLGKNVTVRNTNINYIRIRENLNAYYNHWWNRGKATLRRDYCNTAWKTVASIAAIFLLLLTITQTVFSILQVV